MKDQKITDLIEQEDFTTLNELILAKKIELNDNHYELLSDLGYNSCSYCGYLDISEDLIWIDSEDFEPFDGEELPDKAFEEYSALCMSCYNKLLIK